MRPKTSAVTPTTTIAEAPPTELVVSDLRVNLDAPFELTRLTVGGMCKRGFGRVVFVIREEFAAAGLRVEGPAGSPLQLGLDELKRMEEEAEGGTGA